MLGIIFGSFSYDCTIERHLFVNISDTYLFEIANEVLVTLNLFFFLVFSILRWHYIQKLKGNCEDILFNKFLIMNIFRFQGSC